MYSKSRPTNKTAGDQRSQTSAARGAVTWRLHKL